MVTSPDGTPGVTGLNEVDAGDGDPDAAREKVDERSGGAREIGGGPMEGWV